MVNNGYKQTEVGVIPEDWNIEELDSIIDIVTVKTDSSNVKFYLSTENILPNFEGVNLNININRPNSVTQFRAGDILFSNIRPYLKKAYYASFDGGCSNDVFVFRSKSTYYSKYIFHLIASNKFIDYVMLGSKGTKMPRGDRKQLLRYKQPIPPTKTEQQNIATALGDIDGLITSLEKLLEKKQAIKDGVMEIMLDDTSIEWTETTIGKCFYVKDGVHQTPKYTETGIPFYSVENITANDFINCKYISNEDHKINTRLFKIEYNDLLMTRIGSIGITKYVDWNVNASFYVSLALLKPMGNVDSQFFHQYSKSARFRNSILSHSLLFAAPMKINLGAISNVEIRIPKHKCDQISIAKVLSEMDIEINLIQKRISKAKNIKEGMMQKLLSGAIRLL